MDGSPEIFGTISHDKEKSTANKLHNRQSETFEKKQDSLDYSGTQPRNQPL